MKIYILKEGESTVTFHCTPEMFSKRYKTVKMSQKEAFSQASRVTPSDFFKMKLHAVFGSLANILHPSLHFRNTLSTSGNFLGQRTHTCSCLPNRVSLSYFSLSGPEFFKNKNKKRKKKRNGEKEQKSYIFDTTILSVFHQYAICRKPVVTCMSFLVKTLWCCFFFRLVAACVKMISFVEMHPENATMEKGLESIEHSWWWVGHHLSHSHISLSTWKDPGEMV